MELTENKKDITKSPLFLVAPFFFLGTSMVVMKYIIPDTTPMFLAAFRLLPAGIIILMVAALKKLPQPKTLTAWLWILLFGIVNGAMFQGLLTAGLVHTGAGVGSILIDAQPLVVALLSLFLFGEKIGLWGWLGLTFGIIGISLCGLQDQVFINILSGNGVNLSGISDAFKISNLIQSGELLMILAALSMSFGTIIIRFVKEHADPIVATGWHMIIGSIPLIIFSLLWESNQIDRLDALQWSGLGYATIFGTAVTYGMFFYLAATGNITSVSALIFLTPVFALLFSSYFLREELTQFQWVGVVLTLISVYLVNQRQEITSWIASLNKNKSPLEIGENVIVEGGESKVSGE
jgi:drug/metabolite transporter (DMT)-like permease